MLGHIYLIDDDAPTNIAHNRILNSLKLSESISTFNNAYEALDKMKNGFGDDNPKPELILLDFYMPTIDGFDFLEQLKVLDNKHKFNPKVIILTTSDDILVELRSKTLDFVIHYMKKPLDQHELVNIVEKSFN